MDEAGKQATGILEALGGAASFAEVQRAGRRLLSLPAETSAHQRRVKIALASSYTIDPLAYGLAVESHRLGVWPTVFVDGFNQFYQHLLDQTSRLYEFDPDILFLAAELETISIIDDPSSNVQHAADIAMEKIETLVGVFKKHSRALLVLFNFKDPASFPLSLHPSGDSVHRIVNSRLLAEYADDPQVRILDFERLSAYHGKARSSNPTMRALGDLGISESLLPLVAKQCGGVLRALMGLTRKCLVLDLDGTLWGGVLGECGLDGISLARTGPGREYREFQLGLLELYKRGVILAINSKNDAAAALEVLRKHPDMVLREEHFGSIQINWDDKASNLKVIAQELNIGTDSLVFLDDNPVERQWIRTAMPEVTVYDLPNPVQYNDFLQNLTDFEVLTLTEEDAKRGDLYARDRSRRALETASRTVQEFLVSLNITLTIGEMRQAEIARVAQLISKTNQFNLTGKRYTQTQLAEMAQNPTGNWIYTLRASDIFGDNGLVGVAILHPRDDHPVFDVLLMSCRVLGRGIESAFVQEIADAAATRGAKGLSATYRPSDKNGMSARFLAECGFEETARHEDGSTDWRLSLLYRTYRRPAHLTFATAETPILAGPGQAQGQKLGSVVRQ